MARQAAYDVPWTATTNVTYQDQPTPQTMTLHGTLKGVSTATVEAEYDQA